MDARALALERLRPLQLGDERVEVVAVHDAAEECQVLRAEPLRPVVASHFA